MLFLATLSLTAAQRLPAQGSLTPSGAPAPTMRSLDQVQPRTPIPGGTAGVTISQPGSYYLAGNLSVTTGNGITVNADNVTLDLNGFTISSTASPASGFGVSLNGGRSHVAVSNGHIRGTTTYTGSFNPGGFVSGIDFNGVPRNIRVENVSVSGTANYGIDLSIDRSSTIVGCTVRTTSILGLRAGAISDSAALEVGGANAISAASASNVVGTLTGAGTAVLTTEPTVSSVSAQVTAVQATATATQTAVGTVDPRTRIPGGTAPFSISQSGSYVLTGNITVPDGSAITIQADHVTLDLNGFTLTCVGGVSPGTGVLINGARTNVTVMNGLIAGGTSYNGSIYASAGFFNGIFSSATARNIRIERVSVSGCMRGLEINASDDTSVVKDCTVTTVALTGISAPMVADSVAKTCGGNAINAKVVTGSFGSSTGGYGINAETVSNSRGSTSSTDSTDLGILAQTALNCIGANTGTGHGLAATVATNCRGDAVSNYGVNVSQMATNCSGVSSSSIGLVSYAATMCSGTSGSNIGLLATIGVSCRGSGTPPVSITNRYNMP